MSVEDSLDMACAWSDYRKEFGVSADPSTKRREYKAFRAGWEAARGELGTGGPVQ